MNKIILALMILSSLFILGCKKTFTHAYFMQHPDVMQSEMTRCQENDEESSYCDQVKQSAKEYVALLNVAHDNPVAFGTQIIQAQIELSKAKEALQQAKTQDGDQKKLEEAYESQLQKVNAMLAVVAGTSSPGL